MSVIVRVVALLGCVAISVACTGPTASTEPSSTLHPTPSPDPISTPAPIATPEPSPTVLGAVALIGEQPVIRPTDLGDYGASLAAAYFVDGDTHHAYVVGFADSPQSQRAFHVTSTDGIDWQVDQEDPFADLGLELSRPGAVPGTVMQIGDEWVMYLWGVRAPFPSGAVLWRATADDPAGPWVADPAPILELGERGAWDDLGLDFPAVVPTDDGFLMLYGANGTTHRDAALIGYATSGDGVAWERGPGPVLDPETCGTAPNDFIAQPRVLAIDGGYLALFLAGADMAAATSADGIEWACAGDGPILRGSDLPTGDRVHSFAAAEVDGETRLLIESLVDRGSELWLGRLALP